MDKNFQKYGILQMNQKYTLLFNFALTDSGIPSLTGTSAADTKSRQKECSRK